MFRALVKEQEDLAWAPQPFAVLELAVVRLATMPDGDDVGRLLARLEALERRLAGAERRRGRRAAGRRPSGRAAPRAARSEPQAREAEPAGERRPSARGAAQRARPRERRPRRAAPPEPDAPLGAVLDRLRAFARAKEPGHLRGARRRAQLLERSADRLRIRVPEPFAARRLRERQDAVDALAASFFGRATRVVIEDAPAPASAAPSAARRRARPLRQRRQEALNDPAVGRALEILDADIVEIRPLAEATP